jgi:trans-aconitate 2-methyltransferase
MNHLSAIIPFSGEMMSTPAQYTWNAKDYADHSTAQSQWADELIAKLGLSGTESVLDIGCGDGKVTAKIASHLPFGQILGIDNSRQMIDLARQQYPETLHSNISFARHDARDFELPLHFDIVFSNAALHWVIDHQPVLDCLYRALAPGGRMLLQMGGRGNAASFVEVVESITHQTPWAAFFNDFCFPYGFYGPKVYSQWLIQAGFTPERLELIPKKMTHDSVDKLAGWFRTTWLPYLERIPASDTVTFIDQVMEAYTQLYPPDDSGKVSVKMVRLEVEARKAQV